MIYIEEAQIYRAILNNSYFSPFNSFESPFEWVWGDSSVICEQFSKFNDHCGEHVIVVLTNLNLLRNSQNWPRDSIKPGHSQNTGQTPFVGVFCTHCSILNSSPTFRKIVCIFEGVASVDYQGHSFTVMLDFFPFCVTQWIRVRHADCSKQYQQYYALHHKGLCYLQREKKS